MRLSLTLAIVLALTAASCRDAPEAGGDQEPLDPAVEAGLDQSLATDPDLAGSSDANAALATPGDNALPRIDRSARAVEAARDRAAEMVGGRTALQKIPAPKTVTARDGATQAMRRAALSAVRPGGANCADKVQYTTSWAARLPGAFPVYPRANTLEAAGTDEGACALRVVSFVTPVPLEEVLSFYHTRAKANGYRTEHVQVGADNVLSATNDDAALVVYGRRTDRGITEIDLVTSTP